MNATGGPEVMTFVDVDLNAPAAGEIQVRHEAIGLNYIDVYFRTGLYPVQEAGSRVSSQGFRVKPLYIMSR